MNPALYLLARKLRTKRSMRAEDFLMGQALAGMNQLSGQVAKRRAELDRERALLDISERVDAAMADGELTDDEAHQLAAVLEAGGFGGGKMAEMLTKLRDGQDLTPELADDLRGRLERLMNNTDETKTMLEVNRLANEVGNNFRAIAAIRQDGYKADLNILRNLLA